MKHIYIAAAISMSFIGASANAAEFGVGAYITSNNEIIVPIELGGGDWLVQPSVVHYNHEEPTGDVGVTGLYLNVLKRVKQYEKVAVYAGVNAGMGEAETINRVFDISTSTVQTYKREYSEFLVMPNIQAMYSITENFGIGGQFGIGYWSADYSYDAYSPTPTSIPAQTSTALKSMLIVRYMFR